MTHVTEEQRAEFRAQLEAERDLLDEELGQRGKKVNGDWQGSAVVQDGEEPDPIDAADQIEELVVNVPLVEEMEKRQKEVTAALARIRDGSYGVCLTCGVAIPLARLEVDPAASRCVEHA